MAVNAYYDNTEITKKTFSTKETFKVEIKTDVNPADIKVLAGCPQIALNQKTCKTGEMNAFGKVVFGFTYFLAGEILRAESSTDFNFTAKNEKIAETNTTNVKLSVLKTEYETSGVNLAVVLTVEAECVFYQREKMTFVTGGENVIVKKEKGVFTSSQKPAHATLPVEEEFEVNYAVKTVLFHKEELSVTAVSCGIGSITLDGTAYVSAFLLQNIENSDILKEERAIPFRLELEYPDAYPSMQATATAEIVKSRIDVVVDEEKSTSSFTVTLSVAVDGEGYLNEEKEFTVDAYSKTDEVELTYNTYAYETPKCTFDFDSAFNGEATLSPEMEPASRIMATFTESARVISVKADGDEITAEAVAVNKTFYVNADQNTGSFTTEIPFTVKAVSPYPLETGDDIAVFLHVFDVKTKLISLVKAEVTGSFKLNVSVKKTNTTVTAVDVKQIAVKEENTSAFSVYIASEGEGLWDLSKRLSVSPEELQELNPDLSFPLTGEERIVVYRQKVKEY